MISALQWKLSVRFNRLAIMKAKRKERKATGSVFPIQSRRVVASEFTEIIKDYKIFVIPCKIRECELQTFVFVRLMEIAWSGNEWDNSLLFVVFIIQYTGGIRLWYWKCSSIDQIKAESEENGESGYQKSHLKWFFFKFLIILKKYPLC